MSTDYYIVCKNTDCKDAFWTQADQLTTEEDAQSILDNFQVLADLCQAAKAVDKSPLRVDLCVQLNYIEFDDRNFFIEHRDHNLVVLSEYDVDWAGVHSSTSTEVEVIDPIPQVDMGKVKRFIKWFYGQ